VSEHPAAALTDCPASPPRLTLVGAADRVEAPASEIRVLIADGQALVRAGLRVLLESCERLRVVGEAGTGEQAVALARHLRPDVALVDTRLPGLDPVEATARMLAESGVAVMVMTATEGDEGIFASLRAGASGLLLKDTEPAELGRAVEALARGEALLSPRLVRRLISELASRPEPTSPSAAVLGELTAREREVVALVGLGLSNDEIAERLVVSPATAKTHVSRAMVKLQAHHRAKLVVFAYEAGLVVPGADLYLSAGRPLALATGTRANVPRPGGISRARKVRPSASGSRATTSAARSPSIVLSTGSSVVAQSIDRQKISGTS
jgi:DNA-binding NarL/FixJ family response regulator